ncbi:hypothetical protein [Granulicoccus sp. GXG6511]|uniref:hypothetical protein n=1 Tax=Granulicoccus sp. GXG6511 TaxID=3381351 RepID=UPI003D7CAB65
MDYHYDPLQAVFDGWIVLLMVALFVISAVRLTGPRRSLVAGGFGLCAIATILWLPAVSGVVLAPLISVLGADMVWHVPTLPWVIGIVLVAVGTFRAPRARPAAASSGTPGSAFPPPGTPGPPTAPDGPTASGTDSAYSPETNPSAPDFTPPPGPPTRTVDNGRERP